MICSARSSTAERTKSLTGTCNKAAACSTRDLLSGQSSREDLSAGTCRMIASAVVDLASVPERHYDDQEHIVGDGVDDAVIPSADSKAWSAPQSASRRWTWILCQQGDGALDARPDLRVELAQGPGGRRSKLDTVLGHAQPRSALTCSHGTFGPSSSIAASKAATSSTSSRAAISCS